MSDWRELMKQKWFAEAAHLVEQEYAAGSQYGEHVLNRGWFYEVWGDHEKGNDKDKAIGLYRESLSSYRLYASWSTSGGEGTERMTAVNRIEEKIAELKRLEG